MLEVATTSNSLGVQGGFRPLCVNPSNLHRLEMSTISPKQIKTYLGVFGNVNLVKTHHGPYWYVRFRIKPIGGAGNGTLVSRSTGETDYNKARQVACVIFAKKVAEVNGFPALQEPDLNPIKAVQNLTGDTYIEEVLDLFDQWMDQKTPGSNHPSLGTAGNYKRRLKQLCRLLSVETVEDLRAAYRGLTAAKIRKIQKSRRLKEGETLISDANFVPLVRGAAGVFSLGALDFLDKMGVSIKNPFPSLPSVEWTEFDPPEFEVVQALQRAAEENLRGQKPRDWVLFLLCAGVGMRVQEALHATWRDVKHDHMIIPTRKTKTRKVYLSQEFLDELHSYKEENPADLIIPDAPGPNLREDLTEVPHSRGVRLQRRMAKWVRSELASHGILNVRNPLHYLRKVFGTYMAHEFGIDVAAKAMGNGPVVASRTYVGVLNKPQGNVIKSFG